MWKFDVYYDGEWLHEEGGFETEEEALEEAQAYVKGKTEDWEADGVEWKALFLVETHEL